MSDTPKYSKDNPTIATGMGGTPLPSVPGSMPSVIRVLLHYYADHDHSPAHTYLGEAQELRSDLRAAQ